jgi:ribosomal protein S18 acetylase RimI-like enzyme
MGYYENNNLAGAITYRSVRLNGVDFVDLLFLAVDSGFRRKGVGSKLIFVLKSICKRIVLYADKGSFKFYEENNFTQAKRLGVKLQEIISPWNSSTFYRTGFTDEEIQRIMN